MDTFYDSVGSRDPSVAFQQRIHHFGIVERSKEAWTEEITDDVC